MKLVKQEFLKKYTCLRWLLMDFTHPKKPGSFLAFHQAFPYV
jgi:hypothetical protein